MNSRLDKELCEKYPEIFKDRHSDIRKTCMAFGFECENGWYEIIDNLCNDIMALRLKHVPVATQVKEKFGTLRFYVDRCNDKVFRLIHLAEEASSHICEVCGQKGKLSDKGGSWFKTLCLVHRKALDYKVCKYKTSDFKRCRVKI